MENTVTKLDRTDPRNADYGATQTPGDVARLTEAIKAGRRHWLWETDADLRFSYCSADFERITGHPAMRMIGKSLNEIVIAGKIGQDLLDEQLNSCQRHEPFYDFVYRLENALYRQIYVSTSGHPVYAENGKFLGYRGFSSDITDEYIARQQVRSVLAALHENEQRSRAILDGTVGYLIMLTPDGVILDMNRTALASLVAERETMVGENFVDVAWFRGVPGANAAVSVSIKTAASGTMQKCELSINDPVHGRRIIDFIFNPVTVGQSDSSFIIVDGRDVTERRIAEDRNRNLELQLMGAHKMESLGTLAGGVAHEINTPIQYVGDNVKFLGQAFETVTAMLAAYRELVTAVEAGGDPAHALAALKTASAENDLNFLLEEIPSAIRQSEDGIGHVRQIVLAVKEFSHPDKKEIAPEDLAAAIKTTMMVSRNQWKYVADVELDIEATLPLVPCQIGKINQVLLNLIVNAAQAIEEAKRPEPGIINISARQTGDYVEIRVKDNGVGIKPAHRMRIFDLFFTTKPSGSGNGQGLAICRSIIEREHGGTITFEGEEGMGTTFIVRLPLAYNEDLA
jgi:PAS domain S-box-containing protein